jgi:transposase-like protein
VALRLPAVDQSGQVVDVVVSPRRDAKAARQLFRRAIGTPKITPVEVVTDHAPAHPGVLGELAPAAWHRPDQHADKCVEAGHGRLKARLGTMCGVQAGP